MSNLELVPDLNQLPALQLALDSMELTPNETLLLLSAGPQLSQAADPIAELAQAVTQAAPDDAAEGDEHRNPLTMLLSTIEKAQPEQLRALAVFALQNTWVSEGIELPGGGLRAGI